MGVRRMATHSRPRPISEISRIVCLIAHTVLSIMSLKSAGGKVKRATETSSYDANGSGRRPNEPGKHVVLIIRSSLKKAKRCSGYSEKSTQHASLVRWVVFHSRSHHS